MLFIPALAVLAVLGVVSTGAFSRDPGRYASFVSTRWTSPISLALTVATVAAAALGALGIGLLLATTRARWIALPGTVLALAGTAMMAMSATSVVVRAPGAAHPVLRGRLAAFALNPHVHGTTGAVLTVGGAGLLTLGWIVLGAAVIRAPRLATGDGVALIVAAPVVFLAGFFLRTLPTIGAFLLAAAGLGIAGTAGRLAPGRLPDVAPPRPPRAGLDGILAGWELDGHAGAAAGDGHDGGPYVATLPDGGTVLVPVIVGQLSRDHAPGGSAAGGSSIGGSSADGGGAIGEGDRSGDRFHGEPTALDGHRSNGSGPGGGYGNGRLSRFSRGLASAWQVNRGDARASPARRSGTARSAKGANARPHPPRADRRGHDKDR